MESMIAASPITVLAKRSFKANRSRNRIAVIAIIMTAVMFTTIFTIGFSMLQSMAKLGAGGGGGAQLAVIAVLSVVMILVSGYLIIHNIFQISVSQDIRFYGLLKTLGATKRQISRLLVSQAMKLWTLGLPAGLLAGYGIGALIVPTALTSLGSLAELSVNPLIFLFAALFTLIVVLLSCAKPAGAAGKISPVAALKYTDGDMGGKAKSRRSRRSFSIQTMASENLKRNTRRTAAVVMSIAIGFTLMNSLYVMQHSYDRDTYVNNFIAGDIAVTVGAIDWTASGYGKIGGITQDMAGYIETLPGVTEQGAVYYTESREKLNEDVVSRMTAYYDDENGGQSWWVQSNEDAARQYADVKNSGEATVSVYGIDGFTAPMGRYFAGEYDAQKFATGRYVIAFALADNGEGSVHYVQGDKISIGGKEYELMAVMEPVETLNGVLHSKNNELGIDYAIHTSAFRDSFQGVSPSSLFVNAKDEDSRNSIASSIAQKYPELTVVTPLSYEARFQAQVMAQVLMGYTLGFVMALIGILNFVNAMLTAIISRKREFAMLESLGMTKTQLKNMLIGEGIHYAAIALAISLILSAFCALTVVQETVSTSWAATFRFTLAPFGLIIPAMLALAVLIPLVCFKNTQKQSLTERLRETAG